MKKYGKTLFIGIILILIVFAIAISSVINVGNRNDSNANISVTEEDELIAEAENFITGGASPDDSKYFTSDLTIDEDYKLMSGYSFSSAQHYLSNGAFYLQVDGKMYRFQLNNESKVVSCIVYTVEA